MQVLFIFYVENFMLKITEISIIPLTEVQKKSSLPLKCTKGRFLLYFSISIIQQTKLDLHATII